MSADEFEVDFRFLAGDRRPLGRTMGPVARQFLEDGGAPPVPMPTIGLPEGGALPLFYPGLTAIAAVSGTGKSMMTKAVLRQEVRAGRRVLVLDAETSLGEYTGTLLADFGLIPAQLDLVHYATSVQGQDPLSDRWKGGVTEDLLDEAMDGVTESPSLVVVDSMSKSMAALGLDENQPTATTAWFEGVTWPLIDRWPEAAVVLLQARPKGWVKGMDVRQGRGSSSLLHEVKGQYVMWSKRRGSRTEDGLAEVICTKDRYGHRAEGSLAAHWTYGPSGLALVAAAEVHKASTEDIEQELLDWLSTGPRDPDIDVLPPARSAVEVHAAKALGVEVELVGDVLAGLIQSGYVKSAALLQPGKPGRRPERVWTGTDEPFSVFLPSISG